MRSTARLLLAFLMLAVAAPASAKTPRAALAGLTLGMSEGDAHEYLARRGKRVEEQRDRRDEEKEQESWSLDRGTWGYVSFGVAGGRVDWVTAFARPQGPRVRYKDLGSLAEARRTGTYYVTWKVPARGDERAYQVIARGTDSTYVTSVSLVHDPQEPGSNRPAGAETEH